MFAAAGFCRERLQRLPLPLGDDDRVAFFDSIQECAVAVSSDDHVDPGHLSVQDRVFLHARMGYRHDDVRPVVLGESEGHRRAQF